MSVVQRKISIYKLSIVQGLETLQVAKIKHSNHLENNKKCQNYFESVVFMFLENLKCEDS